MEVMAVANQIKSVIDAIKVEGQRSQELILMEADAMKNYDKGIATRELVHKAAGMAVGLIGHQAKGDSHQLLYDKIVAERTMKAHWERLKYLEAQLNAWQSIFRHLSHT